MRHTPSLAFAAALLCAACSGHAAAPQATPAASNAPFAPRAVSPPPIRMRSQRIGSQYIHFTAQKKNRKVYVVRADDQRGEYLGQGTGRIDFTNPHVVFYQTDGRTVVADAPLGTVIERDKTMLMSGGVHARTQDGKTLSCDRLNYDDATQMLHGEGNVVITAPGGEELQGERVDADLQFSTVHVTGEPRSAS
jgi:LPS export ABC transporter protein LptC